MPTTSLAGDRSRRARNPRDVTGARYAQQQAEQKARKAAANVDVSEVQRQAHEAGFSSGWDAAIGWVIERMTAIGLDPDSLVVADDDDEPGDDDEAAG